MYKIPPYIPIVFHNLSGHDAHLFIKELAALTDGSIVEVDRYIDENGIERLKEI